MGAASRQPTLMGLIRRHGVGNIPLIELYRANTVTVGRWREMQAEEKLADLRRRADLARSLRLEGIAEEFDGRRGR